MTLHQFLLALRGRLWVFLSLLVATVAAAVVVTLLMPKTYEATVSLLLDNRDEQSLQGSVPSGRERLGFMQTQMDIIQSQRVARKVVEDLKLAEGDGVKAAFARSNNKGTVEDWVASGLLASVKVYSTQSSVVQVTYKDSDPKFATTVANAFAKAYMDTTLALRVDPTRQAATWFDEQLKVLRSDLEKAQDRLAKFQKEKGIVATDERLDVEQSRLAELSTQALRAADLTYEAQSRSSLANGNRSPESLPEVIGNPLVAALKTELLRAEAKLQELSTRLGPAHPQYEQQASEIAALRSKMNAEIGRVVAGVQNVTAQNRARQASLQGALDQQRKRVIEMRDARNEAFILTRDVDTAQKAYEAAHARHLVNKVEGAARQTNVTVLNPAVEPSEPSKPRKSLNLALGLLVGLMLGCAAVFLLELLDRRVRSTDDLEAGLDAPLLGTLKPWHPSRLLGSGGTGHKALPSPV
ncbi:MAG TPA: chain length determinant protein EpsF [Usitatibacter sp.]|jgi:chain length determinant protein EpsF|nr:chain length determinant protein EpsF [Usitatibacter sp.]